MNYLIIRQNESIAEQKRERARKRRTFREAKIMIWSIFTGYIMGVIPMVFDYANAHRPTPGIGGEIFFPFLPFILYPVFNWCCNKLWEKVKTNGSRKNF